MVNQEKIYYVLYVKADKAYQRVEKRHWQDKVIVDKGTNKKYVRLSYAGYEKSNFC